MRQLSRQPGDDINIRSGPQMREYHSIARRIIRDGPRHVLDWGCGHGQIMDMLHRAGIRTTGLDYHPDAPTDGLVQLPHFPHLSAYITSDPVKLPFPTGSFDAVLSCGVLEHVGDPGGSLDEIRRVLRPGGSFYVYKLPNQFSYLERIAKAFGIYYHGAWPDDRVYTKRAAMSLLRSHHFTVVEFRRANMLPLTLDGRVATALTGAIWAANRQIARVPVVNLVATNLELVATAP